MSNSYFRNIPDFEYVNRTVDGKIISDYTKVKNLFKRAKIRSDIFENVTFFDKYYIKGNDRPDNVANELYGDPTLDWVILLSNNILNVQSEWPMTQQVFETYLLEKYLTIELTEDTHHYESIEIKDPEGKIIFPEGLEVDEDQSVTYFDRGSESYVTINEMVTEVTNYQYEEKLNDKKREIFVLKAKYLNIIIDDLEEMMEYKKGSTQFVSETLKRADNIRLFE
jgi:hypothetical protein